MLLTLKENRNVMFLTTRKAERQKGGQHDITGIIEEHPGSREG